MSLARNPYDLVEATLLFVVAATPLCIFMSDLNLTTGEPVLRPIYEVLSSHSARKSFAGNMYNKVKDPNLISALTGHVEGNRAFNRYRVIDMDMKMDLVKILEVQSREKIVKSREKSTIFA